MALNKDVIVEAGLRILESFGLGDLSMRRVADSLGVQPGALYYHVPNKQTLLAAIADVILGGVEVPPDGLDPAPWLVGWAHGLRATLLAHRDGAELVSSTVALGLGTVDPAADARQRLAGSPDAVVTTLMYFVLGHVTTQQTRSQLGELGVIDHHDPDAAGAEFAQGVDIIVAGALDGRTRME